MDTKFPNESNFIARSQILMYPLLNLRLAQNLEFNQPFLSLK